MTPDPSTLLHHLLALPDDALVPVGFVRLHLSGEDDPAPPMDLLDVAAIARKLDRSPSTARMLCASGAIRAFKFRGRAWVASPADVAAFLEDERERNAARTAPPTRRRPPRDIDSWRDIVAENA